MLFSSASSIQKSMSTPQANMNLPVFNYIGARFPVIENFSGDNHRMEYLNQNIKNKYQNVEFFSQKKAAPKPSVVPGRSWLPDVPNDESTPHISIGAGSIPFDNDTGIRYSHPQRNTNQVKWTNNVQDYDLHMGQPNYQPWNIPLRGNTENTEKILLPQRSKGIPVQVDDIARPGSPEITKKSQINNSEYSDYSNHSKNKKYQPTKLAHPSDKNGMLLNNYTNEKKIKQALKDIKELKNEYKQLYEENKQNEKKKQNKQNEKNKNLKQEKQTLLDYVPININISYASPPKWMQTPDLYPRSFDDGQDSDKCYGNTLRNWYQTTAQGNQEKQGNNFWKNPAQLLEKRPNTTKKQIVGMPYAPYQPYGHVVQASQENFQTKTPHFVDNAKVSFNRISHQRF
jgi:hypothetical protein